jgi:hypothetical protein
MESLPSSDNAVSENPTRLDPTGKAIIKFRALLDEGSIVLPKSGVSNFTAKRDDGQTENSK